MPWAYDLYHGFSIQILLKEIAFLNPSAAEPQPKGITPSLLELIVTHNLGWWTLGV
jgi:hypothetical protein